MKDERPLRRERQKSLVEARVKSRERRKTSQEGEAKVLGRGKSPRSRQGKKSRAREVTCSASIPTDLTISLLG